MRKLPTLSVRTILLKAQTRIRAFPFRHLFVFLLCCSFWSCGGANAGPPAPPSIFQFDFANGAQGWSAGFADYPIGQESSFQLASGIQPLSSPLDGTKTGFFISGLNLSDELFMFLKAPVTGLKPTTTYSATFHVEFATNAPAGCLGVGGSPGKSVFVKAGATPTEPLPIQVSGFFRMNIDKGAQANGGKDAMVIGNVANSSPDCSNLVYQMKALDSKSPLLVRSDSAGQIWLLVGTNSGFEGRTSLYYTQFRATFTEQP